MVAPYDIGAPVRSFVRVPGSGTDKHATPLCWDLSRSSTVAAAVPVQQTLPSATQIRSMLTPEESSCKNVGTNSGEHRSEAPAPVAEASQNPLPVEPPMEHRSEQSIPEVIGRKRRRYITESGTFERLEADTAGPPPAKSVRVSCKAEENTTDAGPSTAVLSEQEKDVATAESNELAKVIEERDWLQSENLELKAKINDEQEQLRQENLQLKERLALFHDLFKNKNRLAMLLRRLNMYQHTNRVESQ